MTQGGVYKRGKTFWYSPFRGNAPSGAIRCIFKIAFDRLFSAYTNKEINSGENHETYTCFSAVVGEATHRKIDDLSICPPNII